MKQPIASQAQDLFPYTQSLRRDFHRNPELGFHEVRSAGIIALGNVTSRLLGLVRDQIIAGLFGRSGSTDAWFIAQNLSQVFYDLIINGAVSSALVPVFSSYAGEDQRARFWRVCPGFLGASDSRPARDGGC